ETECREGLRHGAAAAEGGRRLAAGGDAALQTEAHDGPNGVRGEGAGPIHCLVRVLTGRLGEDRALAELQGSEGGAAGSEIGGRLGDRDGAGGGCAGELG